MSEINLKKPAAEKKTKLEKKLQVHNLRISFRTSAGKVQAVRDISFDLYKGETLAIVGESGSGKSVTSKAILGIQAANAITEGGEILYDGQDLLKIGEEDFYKLRGDKIAMIYQDPLSSLNPIMRIGKQITEAMLLKGKARQRSCKESFNNKLSALEKAMIASHMAQADHVRQQCKTFRAIEMRHTRLEQAYNQAHEAAQVAQTEIEHLLFLLEKNAFYKKNKKGEALNKPTDECAYNLLKICRLAVEAVHPFVAGAHGDEVKAAAHRLRKLTALPQAELTAELTGLNNWLKEALTLDQPDFFAIGYHEERGSCEAAVGTIAQQNAYYEQELNEYFLNDFLKLTEEALTEHNREYQALRQQAEEVLRQELPAFTAQPTADGQWRAAADKMCKAVQATINPLERIKDSRTCTFAGSLKDFVDTYFKGKRTNGRKQKKYDRQMARFNRLVEKGKQPDWTVAAASTVDLEQTRVNIVELVEHMLAHNAERMQAQENAREQAQALLDDLKASASGMVYRVTKNAAKQKALRLMEEVGIPEPRKRYRNYPFEFSGGMRQRIVIAIALAANPDILICDEPTTALDVTIQAQILELINKLKKEHQLTIIFITHDLGVVANMADRIAVMYAGKIVEYGTAEEIFYQPAHPYTWALLSSMPDLDTKEKLEAIPGTPPNMIYPPKGDAFAERNRYAMKIDFERQPPAFPITETHWAATWLLHPNAPHVDPPKTVTERIAKMKARVEGEANA